MPRALPARPYLPHYRKQARALLKSLQAGDAEASARFAGAIPRLSGGSLEAVQTAGLTLTDALWVLAREHGFESWPRFKHHVEALAATRSSPHRPFELEPGYYEDRARGLLSVLRAGLGSACRIVRERHPAFADATREQILAADLTIEDARLIFAREHGYDDWPAFTAHLERLARGEAREPFREAFLAMKAKDADRLRRLLDAHPDLPTAYGTNANTLLNLAASLFLTPDYSQPPAVDGLAEGAAMQIVRVLLERGADPDQANNRGWTALHQAAYSNHVPLIDQLLEWGASVEAAGHGEGGTPLVQALFWGHREAAERLEREAVTPANLRVAAGLGDLDLIRSLVDADGKVSPQAGVEREFYRPHTGFPVWRVKDDRQQVLDEALTYAARSGRTEAVTVLAARGAAVNGEPYFGTPLHWAAFAGHADTARRLIDLGAKVGRRAGFGAEPSLTALHVAAWNGRTEAARVLLEAGADPTLPDRNYRSSPWGWAGHFGHTETQRVILEAAARVELFAAVFLGNRERVAAILARDPEAVHRNDYWATPLSEAAAKGRLDLVELLLARGADADQRDAGSGQTPLDRALAGGYEDVAERLRAG